MKVIKLTGGILESNGYIIYQNKGGDCYIIDPGHSGPRFVEQIKKNCFNPKGIILTHHHPDHVGGMKAIQEAFDCPTYMHEMDALVFKKTIDVHLKDGDVFDLEGEELKVISTPGHTKGSICLMSEKSRICFTGDTIFDTDLGRSDLPGGDEAEMEDSVRNIISKWENDIFIYPGHDQGATMKTVRTYNTEYLAIMEGQGR